MDKGLIERIALEEAANVMGLEGDEAFIEATPEEIISICARFLHRIDAERGKEADAKEMIRTAPKRIWLQVSDEPDDIDAPFPRQITDEMTWSTCQCVACEVEYVRADLSLAPTIPEGMALLPEVPNKAMAAIMMEDDWDLDDLLAAAQGERNDD